MIIHNQSFVSTIVKLDDSYANMDAQTWAKYEYGHLDMTFELTIEMKLCRIKSILTLSTETKLKKIYFP